jgi:DNA-binding MarR family transcriptional regulator
MVNDLTANQADVLAAIIQQIETFHSAPTVRDLCGLLKISQQRNVERYLSELERKGYIDRCGNRARSIRVLRFVGGQPGVIQLVLS